MEQYRINDLERLTGIKAHTIRIWEKRYLLIKPSRTSTNRRFYNSAQLLKLMNVSTLLSNGHKISSIAALTEQELTQNIEQLVNTSSADIIISNYINQLTYAMLSFDEVAFEDVYTKVVQHLGFYESVLQVFYPFLRSTGMLWRVNKALPVEEHFALCLIRRKLIAGIDALPNSMLSAKCFLLFLPPAEWHEVGLLFADYILRSKGLKTIYIGQNVPIEDIERTYTATAPDFLLTFYVSTKPKEEVKNELLSIIKVTGDTPVLVSGSSELLHGIDFNSPKMVHLKDVGSLAQYF